MSHDPLDTLSTSTPAPSEEAMEKAWLSACCEFHRTRHTPPKPTLIHKWIWPLTAAAVLALLCTILFTPSPPLSPSQTQTPDPLEMAHVFRQGQQLFGNRLKAVSISGDNITWHLHQSSPHQTPPPQVVTMEIKNPNEPNIYLTGYAGTPINIQYAGRQHELEFLPDATGQVIVYGNDIYWDSGTPASPITHAKIQTVTP